MKNKNNYLYIGLGIATLITLIILIFLFLSKTGQDKFISPVVEKNTTETNIQEVSQSIKNTEKTKDLSIINNFEKIKVSLSVDNHEYSIKAKEGISVFETMIQIEKENPNSFSFKYTNNSSLGIFVTEINSKKGSPGKYWIYYVNNKKASIGTSNYVLEEGDIINWEQEGI